MPPRKTPLKIKSFGTQPDATAASPELKNTLATEGFKLARTVTAGASSLSKGVALVLAVGITFIGVFFWFNKDVILRSYEILNDVQRLEMQLEHCHKEFEKLQHRVTALENQLLASK